MSKLKSHSDWLHTKKSILRDTNVQSKKFNYIERSIPGKYTAWPERLRHTDMSLLQAPTKAGVFISEAQRFNSTEKHDVAQVEKQERHMKYQNKINKLAVWNEVLQQRVKAKEDAHEKRCLANDYSMRLTKETYEERCHNLL